MLKGEPTGGSLRGRRIVVAGASGALGSAIARACRAEGAKVGLSYLDHEQGARALAAELGCGAEVARLDVRDHASITEAVSRFSASLGGIDGWVNAVGVVQPGLLVAQAPEVLAELLQVNLLGAIWCCQAVLPELLRQPKREHCQRGVVLNLSSVAARRPYRGQAAYAASKGGLESFTRALAVEYARKGIRALALAPGAVNSPMLGPTRALGEAELLARIPVSRVAEPSEIGSYAAFLLSDRAAYINGSVAVIDGGYEIA